MASSRSLSIMTLVLRLLALMLLAVSIAILVSDKANFSDGTKVSFKDVITYRYVLATAVIGFVYTLGQLPFAIYYVCTEKRLIRNQCLPQFDFYADKIIAFLIATGVGAGFAVTLELKRLARLFFEFLAAFGGSEVDGFKSDAYKFLNKACISLGFLFAGFLCLGLLSVTSSLMKTSTSTSRGFFR